MSSGAAYRTRRARALGTVALAALLLALAAVGAQAATGTVVVKAGHIETLAGDPIEGGSILIVDGRIAEIGTEVQIPAGATVIDLPTARVFPGLVDPYTQLGLSDAGGGPGMNGRIRVADALYPYQEAYEHAARLGFTTLCLGNRAPGIAGEAALVRPLGDSVEEMLVSDRGPLVATYNINAPIPDFIKRALDSGGDDGSQRAVKAAVQGEVPFLVNCGSASDVLRVLKLLEPYKQLKPVIISGASDLYLIAEELGKRKVSIIVPSRISFLRFTRIRIDLPSILTKAGAKVACIPSQDNIPGYSSLRATMGELVRGGLDRDAALKAVTLYPAQMLGLDYRLGTLEVGRDANLVILDGDLLEPSASVLRVLVEGETVYDKDWGGLR
jgi:imidazolonepropionase-like amidohydrolase